MCTSGRRTGRRSATDVRCFLRSSLKPIQAVPLLEGYDDLDADELAIASASHQAEPAQLAAVRKLLARAGAKGDDLECGAQDGAPGRPARAQLLGQARGDAGRVPRTRLAAPPVPRALASAAAAGRGTARREQTSPSTAAACRRSHCALRDGGAVRHVAGTDRSRDARASRARRREGADDTDLMRALRLDGEARRGGLFSLHSPDGRRPGRSSTEDGSTRALRPAIGSGARHRVVPRRSTLTQHPWRGRRLDGLR